MKQIVICFLFSICFLAFTSKTYTQSIACNNHINVSVNETCNLDLTVDAFLEGEGTSIPANVYDYKIYLTSSSNPIVTGDENGPITGGDFDMSPYIGLTLTFEVSNTSGNYCWGTMLIEDKIPPSFTCDCPEGGNGLGGYDPECIIECYELPILQNNYWENLLEELVPSDPDDILDGDIQDNCNNTSNLQISYYDQLTDLGNCQGQILKRTWTLSGFGIPSTACVKEYFVKPLGIDTAIPAPFNNTINGPEPQKIEGVLLLPKSPVEIPSCGIQNDPASIAAYFDNPATIDQDSDGNGKTPQQLDIDDIIENNEGFWCAYPHYYIKGRNPIGPHAQKVDNSVCSILTSYSDLAVDACAPGCNGNSKTIRTWTVLDWCTGEYITYDQIIKVIDQNGPSISVGDVNVSVDPWECSADINMPQPEHLFDDCDNIVRYWITGTNANFQVTGNHVNGYTIHDVPVGHHIVQYLAEDCCGNQSKVHVDVHVTDHTPPVPVTKEFIVTSLTNTGDPNNLDNGISKIFAQYVDSGSYDGCTSVTLEIRRIDTYCDPQDTLWGPFVKFCCDDLGGEAFQEHIVELRVSDAYGNSNLAWSKIRLENKSNPIVYCPEPLIVTCDMDIDDFDMTGLPSGTGACGPFELLIDEADVILNTEPRDKSALTPPLVDIDNDGVYDLVPAYVQGCGFGALRRDFRSEGNLVCQQWIVVEATDPFDPSTIKFPKDHSVDCDNYDFGEPEWLSSSCNLIGVSLESDTFHMEQGACMTIVNNWTVIDWCTYDAFNPNSGGKYSDVQIIRVNDNEDPEINTQDSVVYAAGIDCLSKGVVLEASAIDNGECSSDWIGWEVSIDINSDWVEDYNYSYLQPQLLPNGDPNPFYIPKSANGETIQIVLPDGIRGKKIWHRAVWRASDGCNNNRSHTRYFQISDIKAPTPYCLNLSTAFMDNGEVELWAVDFNVGSFDNCTSNEDLLFTFTDVQPPVRDDDEYDRASDRTWYDGSYWFFDSTNGDYESLSDYGGDVHRWEPATRSSGKVFTASDLDADGFVEVPIYVWDGCENIDFCNVRLRIVDNGGVGNIAGRILSQGGEPIQNVEAELNAAMPGYPKSVMSNSNGEFAFNNAPFNIDYNLSINDDNDDYLNGVSTLDIVLIQRHILGQEQLDSPYKIIAADVNADKNVSAIDLIELRKLILGINNELPESDSWIYLKNGYELNANNVWSYELDQYIMAMSSNQMNQDFMALKIGDVNDSADFGNGNNQIVKRSVSEKIIINEQEVFQNEIVEFTIEHAANNLLGYQFALQVSDLEILEVKGENVFGSEYKIDQDVLTLCNYKMESFGSEFIQIKAKVKSSGRLSDMIKLNKQSLKPEFVTEFGNKTTSNDLELEIRSQSESYFELFQNRPNPFKDMTVIEFSLNKDAQVKFEFFDVQGKLLHSQTGQFDKGMNIIEIETEDLGHSGLIYYQISTNEHTATKLMMAL